MKTLYPVQVAHAAHLRLTIDKHRAALDASQTGTGKTIVAANLAAHYKRPTLVVAPKSSLIMWKRELLDYQVQPLGVINLEKLRTGKTPWGEWAHPLPNQTIWQWNVPTDTLIIWDEVQRCGGMNTQNAKMLWGAKKFFNLCLSATAAKDPTEMKALGFILGLHRLRDFWKWAKLNGCKAGYWGGLDFSGDDNVINQLHHSIFPEHGARLTVEDMKDHFMETQIITTPLDFGDEIKEIYAQMEEELTDLAKKGCPGEAARLRARQKAELCKVPTMVEMTTDFIAEGRSVPLFVNFTATLEALRERLPSEFNVGMISGGYVKDRQKYMDAFQNDDSRALICNVMAGGISVNLQDVTGKHPRAAIISPSDNEKDILQCIGRVYRAGGLTPSQQHILFAAGTIEEDVEENCRRKMNQIDIFNDGLEEKVVAPVEETVSPSTIQKMSTKIEGRIEEHAEYAPSSLSYYEKCPGFRNREDSDTEASERGTRVHIALQHDKISSLPEDERPVAQVMKDYIDAVIQDNLPKHPDADYRELRVDIDLGGGLTTFGTSDRLIIYGILAKMFDYKTGYLEITDAEENAQGWAYVIGAFQKFPFLEEIEFTFLVPNRDEVLYHTFKRADVPSMQLRLNTIIRKAMAIDWSVPSAISDSDLHPQPGVCEYCKYQTKCTALARKALIVAARLGPGLPIPNSLIVDAKTNPKDIADMLRLAPLLEKWAVGVRSAALKANMEDGVDIPGFKRYERSTDRTVTTVLGAWDTVKDQIPLEDFLSACAGVSVVKLEDFVANLTKKGKGKARTDLNNKLREASVLNEQGTIYYLRENKTKS